MLWYCHVRCRTNYVNILLFFHSFKFNFWLDLKTFHYLHLIHNSFVQKEKTKQKTNNKCTNNNNNKKSKQLHSPNNTLHHWPPTDAGVQSVWPGGWQSYCWSGPKNIQTEQCHSGTANSPKIHTTITHYQLKKKKREGTLNRDLTF